MRHLFLLAFVTACATTPSGQNIQHTFNYEASLEEVWEAAVDLLEELDLPIETLEKDSGRITTGWFGIDSGNDYVDCGRQAPGELSYFSGRLELLAREEREVVEVEVTSTFRASMRDPATNYMVEVRCYSTGNLESQVSRQLEERVGSAGSHRSPGIISAWVPQSSMVP